MYLAATSSIQDIIEQGLKRWELAGLVRSCKSLCEVHMRQKSMKISDYEYVKIIIIKVHKKKELSPLTLSTQG